MTSADNRAKAVMRAYADNLRPPPVADIIARADDTPAAQQLSATAPPRFRGHLVLATASVAAAVAGVAVVVAWLPDQGTTGATGAPQPSASTAAVRMAPACPPDLPVLEGPFAADGKAARPSAEPGQQLTLPAKITVTESDRRLLTFQVYLLPSGADMNERDQAVARTAVMEVSPNQARISPVLQIPTGLAPGAYDLVGYATFPSPSLCGVANKADSTQVGTIWGVLGSVVIE